VGGRYVYCEDRARNVVMCAWDPEMPALAVVAPPAPDTRRFTAVDGPTALVWHGGDVVALGYDVCGLSDPTGHRRIPTGGGNVGDHAPEVASEAFLREATAVPGCWRSRLEITRHTETSRALARMCEDSYPFDSDEKRRVMTTERTATESWQRPSEQSASRSLRPPSSSPSSSSSSSGGGGGGGGDDGMVKNASVWIPRPTRAVSVGATLWLANDSGLVVAARVA
jgi:hypothetical protein